MSPNPTPKSPKFPPPWLRVIINILIALALVGSFLWFYIQGNIMAWVDDKDHSKWPAEGPILEALLSAVGGVMSAFFAVALNLERPRPSPTRRDSFAGMVQSVQQLLRILKPKKPKKPPKAIDWEKVEENALYLFGIVLTLAFPILTIASAVTELGFSTGAPEFVSSFAGPGVGVLVGAFTVWVAKITQP